MIDMMMAILLYLNIIFFIYLCCILTYKCYPMISAPMTMFVLVLMIKDMIIDHLHQDILS